MPKLPATTKKNTKNRTTKKKVKYIGTEKYINASTGEIQEFSVTEIAERDFNFSKVWMQNFIVTLDLVGNQKTKLALWIIDHLNKENQLIYTTREMAEESGICLKTVSTTMKILMGADFLRKCKNGVYTINPDVVFKGSRTARLNVLNQYHALDYEAPTLTKQEKISQLKQSIEVLQAELVNLQEEEDIIDADINPQYTLGADAEGNLGVIQEAEVMK